jgi:SAM-dependent methyltransferase
MRTRLVVLLVALSCAAFATAQTATYGDDVFQPSMGQPGKDVIWIPTPDTLVTAMLAAAKVTRDDVVFDLGAGDGKIPIAAAREHGARATGIEFNPDMAELARRNARRANVESLVTIVTGDIFKEDFSHATVVTMYLLPDLNMRLRPLILKMKPGTRVVSHAFHMGDWDPDERLMAEAREAFLWIVPASVEGTWAFEEENGAQSKGTVTLTQRYQRIGGTVTAGGRTQPLLSPTLRGDQLAFSYVDADNTLRSVRATVADREFKGEVSLHGRRSAITAARRS